MSNALKETLSKVQNEQKNNPVMKWLIQYLEQRNYIPEEETGALAKRYNEIVKFCKTKNN